MRLVVGFFIYLLAVVAIGSGAAAVLSAMKESSAPTAAAARPEPAPLASPRIQAWLERRAQGVTFAEKEKTAAEAGRERADALRARLAATPEPLALPRARGAEEGRADHRERAAPAGESAKRQTRRRLNEPQREARPRFTESRSAYGYASEPRWRSYPAQLLTLRDRASP